MCPHNVGKCLWLCLYLLYMISLRGYVRCTAETTSMPQEEGTPEQKGTTQPGGAPEPESTPQAEGTTEPEGTPQAEGTAEPEGTPQAEGTTEPEGTPQAEGTAEPEGTPQAGGTTEPEGTPQAEGTAEPEGTPQTGGTPEPETTPLAEGKPEITPLTEVTSEQVSTSEPEGTSEPENISEPESTSEPEGTSEPVGTSEPDGTSEPVGTSEPESTSEPEGTSEPVGTSEPESTSEPEGTSEPESTFEPEGTSEPESNSEPKGASKPEGPSETNPETGAEPESEPENEPESEGPVPEERPHAAEVVVPPFTMMTVIIIALVGLSIWSKQDALKVSLKKISRYLCTLQLPYSKCKQTGSQAKVIRVTARVSPEKPILTDAYPLQVADSGTQIFTLHQRDDKEKVGQKKKKPFLTGFDKEVLRTMGASTNSVPELLRIATPALLSLALCPGTLYLYEPLVNAFWPFEKGFQVPPDINEAIACFLAPAGLVYATCFGFAFQQALTKQTEIRAKVSHEIGLLDQISTLASKLTMPTVSDKMDIYQAVKAEAIFMVLQIERKEPTDFKNRPTEDVKVKIWSILDILRRIVNSSVTQTFDVDRIIAERIVNHTLELNSICSDRMGTLHARIHPLKWAFLECLGFFSFFGILLLKAESYRVELTMCVITVFSISLMCYVVSDLDCPFSGFFRIDVTVLHNLVHRVKTMYEAAEMGATEPLRYPQQKDLYL